MASKIVGSPNFHKAIGRYEQLLAETRRELEREKRRKTRSGHGRIAAAGLIAVGLFVAGQLAWQAAGAGRVSAGERADGPVVETVVLGEHRFRAVGDPGEDVPTVTLIGADGKPRGWVSAAEFWPGNTFGLGSISIEHFVIRHLHPGTVSAREAAGLLRAAGPSGVFVESVAEKLGKAIETGQFADGVPRDVSFRLDRRGHSWVRW